MVLSFIHLTKYILILYFSYIILKGYEYHKLYPLNEVVLSS